MTKRITAKELRKMIPPSDLKDKAFQPERDFGSGGEPLAVSLGQLAELMGSYATVAVLSTRFDAIFDWLRRDKPAGLCADMKVVREALTLTRENALYEAGLSRRNGLHLPILQRISDESQAEAERIVDDTLARWAEAGQPRLTSQAIRWSHRMFLYRVRLKEHTARRAAMELAA